MHILVVSFDVNSSYLNYVNHIRVFHITAESNRLFITFAFK